MKNQTMIPVILTLSGASRFPRYTGHLAWKIPFKKERGRNQGWVNVLVNGNDRPIMFNREFWKTA